MHKAPEPDQAASHPTSSPAACGGSPHDDDGSPSGERALGGGPPGGGGARSGAARLHAGCAWLMRFTAGWVFCAMGTAGVSLLEKQRRYGEACDRLRLLLGALRALPAAAGTVLTFGGHVLLLQAIPACPFRRDEPLLHPAPLWHVPSCARSHQGTACLAAKRQYW